jgi:hypothetical protein
MRVHEKVLSLAYGFVRFFFSFFGRSPRAAHSAQPEDLL